MMINWLLYSLLAAGLLAVAGLAFEYGARALRLPTRWVWIGVMALSSVFSTLMLMKWLVPARTAPVAYAYPEAGSPKNSMPVRIRNQTTRPRPWDQPDRSLMQPIVDKVLGSVGGLGAPIGISAGRSFNMPLMVACGALAIIGLSTLAISFARLSGVAYALEEDVVEGVPVLLSRNIGPALLGVFRFRIVLPRWVTEMSSTDIRIIIAHEQEHALAGDPTLALLGLLFVALQPWNPALWFALSRLRLSTELDCDARVLGVDGDARRYGRVLVDVYQRTYSGLAPLTAFVHRTSQLESRIRRLVDVSPRSFSARTIASFAAALMLCALAYSIEVTGPRANVFDEPAAPAMDSVKVMASAARATQSVPTRRATTVAIDSAEVRRSRLNVVRAAQRDSVTRTGSTRP